MSVGDVIVSAVKRRPRRSGVGLLLILAASVAAAAPLDDTSPATRLLPVVYSRPAAAAYARAHPGTAPAGANDWSCRPSAAHPRPVVLVHGALENMTFNWFTLAPLLKNAGYCVYALNYGQQKTRHGGDPGAAHPGGTARIERSAKQFARFVDRVLAATRVAAVDIVGHSEGGMMPRYYMRFDAGAPKVHTLIGLSPANHGRRITATERAIDVTAILRRRLGTALSELASDSALMTRLNAGGDTVPGVAYTVIQTRYDEILRPYTSAFLTGVAVTNITLQSECPLDLSEHSATSFDSIALRLVLNALDPSRAVAPTCRVVLPFVGG